MTMISHPELEGLGRYKFGWADSDVAGASARRGLSEAVVRDISAKKNEPAWMPTGTGAARPPGIRHCWRQRAYEPSRSHGRRMSHKNPWA
jgi:hypothetical protein